MLLSNLERLIGLPVVWLLVVLALVLVRRKVIAWAHRLAGSDATAGDSRAVTLLARIYMPALLLAGAYASIQILPLNDRWLSLAERWWSILALLVAVALAWRGFSLLLGYWAATNPHAGVMVPPVQLVGRILFVVIGITLVFSALGYELGKLWTALGIGTVAVALAMQETLSNLLAGFHLMLDQPMRVGDYIRLDTGEEGWVTHVGWRSTWLRMNANNMVVVPNSKLARASLTNFTLPEPRLAVLVPVSVAYGTDTRKVERVLLEVAAGAIGQVEGLLADPPPLVRFVPGFGGYSLDFTLICQARDFPAQFVVQTELRHRILERFQREAIEIPFPVQTVRLARSEDAHSASAGQ